MVADLRAESDALDTLVADLPEAGWQTATPAPGWTVAHQIAHLWWTDRVSLKSVTDKDAFAAVLGAAAKDPLGFVDAGAEELALTPPAELLTSWRRDRAALHDALLSVADGRKLPWFGPPMSAPSMATARLMETWAHGQDIADALAVMKGHALADQAGVELVAHVALEALAGQIGREIPHELQHPAHELGGDDEDGDPGNGGQGEARF